MEKTTKSISSLITAFETRNELLHEEIKRNEEAIKKDIAMQKAIDFITENAKEKAAKKAAAKKAKEETAEEGEEKPKKAAKAKKEEAAEEKTEE